MKRRHDPPLHRAGGPRRRFAGLAGSAGRLLAASGLLLGILGVAVLVPTIVSPTSVAAAATSPAYWLVASDGGVFSFGGAGFYGSAGDIDLNAPVVGMAATPDSGGYWLVASDGGIFTYGDAHFYGSMGGQPLDKPVVGIATTPNGQGYWEVASDGGIFSFGNAQFYGSMGGRPLNQPIVGIAATPDGGGYWEVASDGGIFAFGDAQFYGSTGGMQLNKPIVGMAANPNGQGYWLVASDGGIFAFGDAPFEGSLGNVPLARPIVAIAAVPEGNGYWFTDDNGAVTAFGSAGYYGSAPQVLNAPVVGMAEGAGTGANGADSFQSGSYGYDVSNWQCDDALPSGHAIGIVEVEGASFGATNPCLAQEANWAGSGLNLYIYMTYGTAGDGPAFCDGDAACAYGYQAAQYAYNQAVDAGVDAQVTWWLDIENPGSSWSSDLSENAELVMGALQGIRSEGVNNVGIYASPGDWNEIVGDYQPDVPYWMAWWTGSGPYNCANAGQYTDNPNYALPTGGVVLTQYSDDVGGFDGDYAC